jgi:hypothetical protein
MTGIDVSMYPKTPPDPMNPLKMMQGYATLQHSMGENKLQQKAILGKEAIGKIVTENTDEQGNLNARGFLKSVAQDPNASWMYLQQQQEYNSANPLTEYMGTNEQGVPTPSKAPLMSVPGLFPEIPQEKIDKLHAHNRAMLGTLGPLMEDPDLDHKKVIRAVSDLVANPEAEFNALDGATALSGMPYGPEGKPPTKEAVMERLQPLLEQFKSHETALSERYPSSEQLAQRQPAPVQPESSDEQPASPVELHGPGVATGTPAGYTAPGPKSRESYDNVVDEAESVPQRLQAYNEIINLANSGAPSGTVFANMVKKAATIPGLQSLGDITDDAAKGQALSKYMSQALLGNGMPASDSRLQELQSGNLNTDQLIETVKKLAPAFKAVAKGAVEKQKYYNRETRDGNDLSREPKAAETWNDNFDPRWIEYADQKNKDEKKKFLTTHPDMLESVDKFNNLKKMGVIGKRE